MVRNTYFIPKHKLYEKWWLGELFVVICVVDRFRVQSFSYWFHPAKSFLSKLAGPSSLHLHLCIDSLTHYRKYLLQNQSVSSCSRSPRWLLVCLETRVKDSPAGAGSAVTSGTSSSYEQTSQGVSERQEKVDGFDLPVFKISSPLPKDSDNIC